MIRLSCDRQKVRPVLENVGEYGGIDYMVETEFNAPHGLLLQEFFLRSVLYQGSNGTSTRSETYPDPALRRSLELTWGIKTRKETVYEVYQLPNATVRLSSEWFEIEGKSEVVEKEYAELLKKKE